MEPMNNWEPVAVDGKQEITSHREPGEEFMFYRSVAAGLIDAVQDNCSRGAFENMEGAGKLSDNPGTNLRDHFAVTRHSASATSISGGWTAAPTSRRSSTSMTRWPWISCAGCGG